MHLISKFMCIILWMLPCCKGVAKPIEWVLNFKRYKNSKGIRHQALYALNVLCDTGPMGINRIKILSPCYMLYHECLLCNDDHYQPITSALLKHSTTIHFHFLYMRFHLERWNTVVKSTITQIICKHILSEIRQFISTTFSIKTEF